MKKKYGIKKIYEYFDSVSREKIDVEETKYDLFKDFFVVEQKEKLKNILDEAKQKNMEINLLFLENEDIFQIVNSSKDGEFLTSTFFNKIISRIKIKPSSLFGMKSREESIKNLEWSITNLEKVKENIIEAKPFVYDLKNLLILNNQIKKEYPNLDEIIKEDKIKSFSIELDNINEELIKKLDEKKSLEVRLLGRTDEINKNKEQIKILTSKIGTITNTDEKEKNDLKEFEEEKESIENEGKSLEIFISEYEKEILKFNEMSNLNLDLNIDIADLQKLFGNFELEKQKFANLIESIKKIMIDYESELSDLKTEIDEAKRISDKLTGDKRNLHKSIEINEKIIDSIWESRVSSVFSGEIKENLIIKVQFESNSIELDNFDDYINNLKKDQTTVLNKCINLTQQVAIEYGINNINILDNWESEQIIELNEIENKLDIEFLDLKFEKIINERKIGIQNSLKHVISDFSAHLLFIIKSVIDSVNEAKKDSRKYSETGSLSNFGEITGVEFKIIENSEFKRLTELYKKILMKDQFETLNELLNEIKKTKEKSILSYYAKDIFLNKGIDPTYVLDFHKYFDLKIEIFKKNVKQNKLRTSGGEGLGLKFLIYSCIFNMFRNREPLSINEGEIFIFFDEYNAIDPNTLNSMAEIAKNLKINALFAGTDISTAIPSDSIGYFIENGIISSLSPQVIAEFKKEEK